MHETAQLSAPQNADIEMQNKELLSADFYLAKGIELLKQNKFIDGKKYCLLSINCLTNSVNLIIFSAKIYSCITEVQNVSSRLAGKSLILQALLLHEILKKITRLEIKDTSLKDSFMPCVKEAYLQTYRFYLATAHYYRTQHRCQNRAMRAYINASRALSTITNIDSEYSYNSPLIHDLYLEINTFFVQQASTNLRYNKQALSYFASLALDLYLFDTNLAEPALILEMYDTLNKYKLSIPNYPIFFELTLLLFASEGKKIDFIEGACSGQISQTKTGETLIVIIQNYFTQPWELFELAERINKIVGNDIAHKDGLHLRITADQNFKNLYFRWLDTWLNETILVRDSKQSFRYLLRHQLLNYFDFEKENHERYFNIITAKAQFDSDLPIDELEKKAKAMEQPNSPFTPTLLHSQQSTTLFYSGNTTSTQQNSLQLLQETYSSDIEMAI